MGRPKKNPESEPFKRCNVSLSADDLTLLDRFKVELIQNGPTGVFRALMVKEAKRLGWIAPDAPQGQQRGKS